MREHFSQQRQQAVADLVARVRQVAVGWVVDVGDTARIQFIANFLRAEAKQRTHKANAKTLEFGRHAGEARHTGATAERQQQRFDLVIGMLRQRDCTNFKLDGFACQRGVARLAGGVFGTLASRIFCLYAHHVQRHVKGHTSGLAVPHKIISGSLQAVVDMNRRDPPWPLGGSGMHQSGRISAAAVG